MNVEKAEKVLSLQLDWIKTGDSKVPPLFAINIAMLGVLAALIKSLHTWTIPTAIFCSLTFVLLLVSIACLMLTIFPRLNGPKDSNVFFGGISKQSETKYKEQFLCLKEDEYLDDVLSQSYRNAEIATQKYHFLKLASISMFACVPFWLISIYLLYL